MKKETFEIGGMSCTACSAAVEKAVNKLCGVKKAQVNLLSGSMYAQFDESEVSADDIIKAVVSAGYNAKIMDISHNVESQKFDITANKIKVRLILSIVFLIPLMLVSMGHIIGIKIIPHDMMMLKGIVEVAILLPILILNIKYFTSGFKGLIKLNPNMDSLIATGATASIIYSLWQLCAGGAEHYYFESAGMILTFITIGKFIESKSKAKTTLAVTKLMDLSPKTSIVLRYGNEIEIDSKEIKVSDIVIVKSGMSFPADGEIIEGQGYADESAITGESLPVKKVSGSKVIGGTVLTSGYVKFRAEKVGEETTLFGIIKLVEEAILSKPKIQRFADKISRVFVPSVIAIAIATFIIWYAVSKDFELALNFSISVLVISCPCALGLATPTAIMVGTGRASQLGILIKNAEVFEAGAKVSTVMLDKTGTITEGKPVVSEFYCKSEDRDRLIKIVSKIESFSDHPLAQAIVSYCADTSGIEITGFESKTGEGVKAFVGKNEYKIGKKAFVADRDINAELVSFAEEESAKGKTVVYVSKDNDVVAAISIADAIKNQSYDAIKILNDSDINTVMITGDSKITAQNIGKEVGISDIHAELLPSNKNDIIRKYQKNSKVAMVGDGINDSPALATADIGIALGAGTDIAIDSADVVLIKNDLRDVHTTINVCKKVMRNIKENLFWALCYNVVCIPVAAGALYTAFGIALSPMLGTVAMSLSSICVIANALRLRNIKSKYESERKEINTMKTVYIEGMACMHCSARVTQLLSSLDENVVVSHENGTAVIADSADNDAIISAVESGGYKVIRIE